MGVDLVQEPEPISLTNMMNQLVVLDKRRVLPLAEAGGGLQLHLFHLRQVSVPQPVPGILAASALASAAAAAADPVQQDDVQQQDEPLRAAEIVVYSRRAAKKLRSSLDDNVATFGIYDKSTVFTEHDHDSA